VATGKPLSRTAETLRSDGSRTALRLLLALSRRGRPSPRAAAGICRRSSLTKGACCSSVSRAGSEAAGDVGVDLQRLRPTRQVPDEQP